MQVTLKLKTWDKDTMILYMYVYFSKIIQTRRCRKDVQRCMYDILLILCLIFIHILPIEDVSALGG